MRGRALHDGVPADKDEGGGAQLYREAGKQGKVNASQKKLLHWVKKW